MSSHIPTLSEQDEDGTLIVRPKFAAKGWTYHMRAIEFTSSTLNSVYNKKYDGVTDWGDAIIKFYNAAEAEITDQGVLDTDCVTTVVDFEALYDLEVIGGSIMPLTVPSANFRFWVIAVPDIPEGSGGSKVMINGLNLYFRNAKSAITIDGRTSKRLTYNSTYHTNKLRLIFRHAAGEKLNIQFVLEHYKL